jgi:hypothetical protein
MLSESRLISTYLREGESCNRQPAPVIDPRTKELLLDRCPGCLQGRTAIQAVIAQVKRMVADPA